MLSFLLGMHPSKLKGKIPIMVMNKGRREYQNRFKYLYTKMLKKYGEKTGNIKERVRIT